MLCPRRHGSWSPPAVSFPSWYFFLLPLCLKLLIRRLCLNALSCRIFWICALLFNGCLTTPKGIVSFKRSSSCLLDYPNFTACPLDYRYRSQSQNRNIGDDTDDESLSPGSDLGDSGSKSAAWNTPTGGSSQKNVQTRTSGQAAGQRNRVAQGSAANDPLVFPMSNQLGANQQSPATRFTKEMPQSSNGFSVYAPQSGGQSHLKSGYQGPGATGPLYEEFFHHHVDSGPAQHYGAGRGHDGGRNSQNLGGHGSTLDARPPFHQHHQAHLVGPSGVVHRNPAPASSSQGLNANVEETVPHTGNAHFMRPPASYDPVYLTQSRHGYSHARYTHFQSRYLPDLYAPMPVDPQPLQDPVRREETHRYCD